MSCAICRASEAAPDLIGTLLCRRCDAVLDHGSDEDYLALYAELIGFHPEPEQIHQAVLRVTSILLKRALSPNR